MTFPTVTPNSGLTYSVAHDTSPSSGYVVSLPDTEQTVSPSEFFGPRQGDILAAYVAAHWGKLQQPNVHLGVYHSEAAGIVYLDLSEVIPDRNEAARRGYLRNQESIYHLDTGEVITLDTERGRQVSLTLAGA